MYSHGSWILHGCDGSHENNYFPNYTTLDPWDLALELILDVIGALMLIFNGSLMEGLLNTGMEIVKALTRSSLLHY